ncbi:hypothetical protein BDZ89DRAFT_353872 [Hymenopellis radicata]|nr:hypothetical protein BDZ89DRAFT_353872 [Hymenopellis radicata]
MCSPISKLMPGHFHPVGSGWRAVGKRELRGRKRMRPDNRFGWIFVHILLSIHSLAKPFCYDYYAIHYARPHLPLARFELSFIGLGVVPCWHVVHETKQYLSHHHCTTSQIHRRAVSVCASVRPSSSLSPPTCLWLLLQVQQTRRPASMFIR